MGGFDISPSDFVGMIPLSLEVNGLFVPVADGGGDGVHGHDSAHEGGRDPSRIVSNENIFVVNVGHGYIVLEEGGVFCKGRGVFVSSSVLSRFLDHSLGREPGDCVSFHIVVFKCGFKVCDEN